MEIFISDSMWVDWHPNGNLLACACCGSVKIVDTREGRIVKVFDITTVTGSKFTTLTPSNMMPFFTQT